MPFNVHVYSLCNAGWQDALCSKFYGGWRDQKQCRTPPQQPEYDLYSLIRPERNPLFYCLQDIVQNNQVPAKESC